MKVFLKNSLVLSLVLVSLFFFTACENATKIRAVSITEITSAGSDNYGIRIAFQEDKRIEEKGVDIQVKSSKVGDVIIWQEGKKKETISFTESDKWYSLTTLFVMAQDKPNTETFEEFGQALTKTYLFNSSDSKALTFRVIVGDIEPNIHGSGQVLTGSMDVSKEFVLKIKK